MNKNVVEILCAKDENAAKIAAVEFIEQSDLNQFEKLCEKMDFLFDFVRENVYKRLDNAINQENYKSVIKFFEIYSTYFDDFFMSILVKYADDNLTNEILKILTSGSDSQKAYAAMYFKKNPNKESIKYLEENLSTDFEPLFINCAAALGKINSTEVFEKYKNDLSSENEFAQLNAVKFLVAFGNKNVLELLTDSMINSKIPENIAGEIVNLVSPTNFIKNDFENGAILFNYLINGLGEILPLENIFYYEIFEIAEFLIKNELPFESTVLLCNLKSKFNILTENEEYIFDLDKNTKNEIFEIKNLLCNQSKEFWNEQVKNLKEFINENSPYLETVLEIIKEEKIKDFTEDLYKLLKSNNETIICEAIMALKEIDGLDKVDKTQLNIKNQNLKALLEQIFIE